MRMCNKWECGNGYECLTKIEIRYQGSSHTAGDTWVRYAADKSWYRYECVTNMKLGADEWYDKLQLKQEFDWNV